MFYFNQPAAERRPIRRAVARANVQILVHGYKAAVERGRAAADVARPKIQLLIQKKLAHEAAAGEVRVEGLLQAIDAELADL